MKKKPKNIFYNDEWNDDEEMNNFPIRKTKRIRNDIKRNKIKNNRGGASSGRSTDQGSEGADY